MGHGQRQPKDCSAFPKTARYIPCALCAEGVLSCSEKTPFQARWTGTCACSIPGVDGMPERVGFAGIGIMGRPMARNIMEACYELVLYNRTQSKAEDMAREGGTEVAG